ncbi:MAG TPA: AAA family ATPase [Iamia sp.]
MATTATPSERLSLIRRVDDLDDLLSSVGLVAFADGTQPVARWLELPRTTSLTTDDLAIADGRPTRWMSWGTLTGVLVEGSGWSAVLRRREADEDDDATTTAWVSADTHDRLDDVCALLRKALDGGAAPADTTVSLRCWNARGGWSDRVVEAPRWDDVRRNYAAAVRPALDRLVDLDRASVPAGRLILLHGVPGTGKSTFIRALARAWRSWCATEVLGDPQQSLGSSQALESVLFTRALDADGTELPWKVLVVEDAHELVSATATGGASEALTRLLHATDGVVGGQARILFLLTTNHRLDRVHPALLRPGRCLAEIEIPPLSAVEATAWLGGEATVRVPTTLAELYAHGREDDVIRHRVEVASPGQYL